MNHDIHRGRSHETIRKTRQVQMPLVLFDAKTRSSQKKKKTCRKIPCWCDGGKNRRFRLRLVSFEEPPVPKKKETGASGSVRKRKLLAHRLLLFFHVFFV